MSENGPARRRSAGRTVTALGIGCALAACGVLSYAAYELWGTGREERAVQTELREAFESVAVEPVDAPSTRASGDAAGGADDAAPDEPVAVVDEMPSPRLPGDVDPGVAALQFPDEGVALARLEIPAIGVDKFVMRDVSVESLRAGPGHYLGTVRPGFEGNAAIAGHRTTYGAPFGRVDELEAGDEVTVYSADGRFTYVVLSPDEAFGDRLDEIDEVNGGHVVVDPEDTWVVSDFGDARLTLTSCHPEFTSRDRIVVVAELVSEAVPMPDLFRGLDDDALLELVSEDLSVLDAS